MEDRIVKRVNARQVNARQVNARQENARQVNASQENAGQINAHKINVQRTGFRVEKVGRKKARSIKGRTIKGIGIFIEDLLFPRRCPVCDGLVRFRQELICPTCLEKIKFISGPTCMKCGKALQEEVEYCYDCRSKRHAYIQGAAVFDYGSIAASLYRFKYAGRREYAEFFGSCMADRLEKRLKQWKVQALIPVPIHSSRKRKRGYNQAQQLAEVIGSITGIPVYNNLIVRRKKTVPQKELNEAQRQNNLKKAFKILENDVKLDTIVIIDDIYTTGSTIDAMTAVFHAAGIGHVYYVALAIGKGL